MRHPLLDQPARVADRRAAARSRVAEDAHLQTPGGDWRGTLWDLSETGARLQVANPPGAGATALLRWAGHECFCRVAWATGDMCGLAFDRPLARTLVRDAVARHDGPRPTLGNIPLGQKRSRPV